MNFPGSAAPRHTSQLESGESGISKIPNLERGVKKIWGPIPAKSWSESSSNKQATVWESVALELENLGAPANHSTPVGDKKKGHLKLEKLYFIILKNASTFQVPISVLEQVQHIGFSLILREKGILNLCGSPFFFKMQD